MNLTTFAFDGQAVRTVTDADGTALFCGRDIAIALGYRDPHDAIKSICKGPAISRPLPTSGGVQQIRVITEPDVLRLIVKSTLPAAERFERWVFEEVLPQIRRTGAYAATPAVPQTMAQALRLAADQAEQLERQQALIAEQAVDVEALKRLANTDGLLCLRDAAKAVGMPPLKFNAWLDQHRWTYVQQAGEDAKRDRRAYQTRIQSGDLVHKLVPYGKPEDQKSTVQVMVTKAGVTKLAKLTKAKGSDA